MGVQFVEHDAGFHSGPALFGIHFEQAVVVFRNVDVDAFADGLASLRSASATHGDGRAMLGANGKDPQNIFAFLGDCDA